MVAHQIGKAKIPPLKGRCFACSRCFEGGETVMSALMEGSERRDLCEPCFERSDVSNFSCWWKSVFPAASEAERQPPQGDLGCLQRVRSLLTEASEEYAAMLAYVLLLYLERREVVRQSRSREGLVFEVVRTGESFFLSYPEPATVSPEVIQALRQVMG